MFDIEKFRNISFNQNRYLKRINALKDKGYSTIHIESAVNNAILNIQNNINSFVIYGDPQSGKTEMMIALTAKLLDLDYQIIIVLLNDNVGLLEQNLRRFSNSDIEPDPKNFKDILDQTVEIANHKWIIFCKKNSSDLKKLINKLEKYDKPVIIDDEADYASPNGKVNCENNEKTKINELIEELLKKGIYIGVTATPARLDLNNTFDNANNKWVSFESHENYTGQDVFFPLDMSQPKFRLKILPKNYDDPKYLREALFRFFINVSYLNIYENNIKENYSFLVHTSGSKNDHLKDYEEIQKIINVIKDDGNSKFERYIKSIWDIASYYYDEEKADEILKHILENKNKNTVLVINSEKDKENLDKASNPISIFTIAIGGNIVSRGVTFNNLLSMYFTRTVKSKMQQDTYIQRARMFGNRNKYLSFFELSIPERLYIDWQRCFVFHKLAIESIKSGNIPVWLEDSRTRVASPQSIAKTTVELNSGEMSFSLFNYSPEVNKIINNDSKPYEKLLNLQSYLGLDALPQHLLNFINHFSPDGQDSLAIHESTDISKRGEDTNKEEITRAKGLIGTTEMEKQKFPHAIHHIKIFYNKSNNRSRVFYRFNGSIKFLSNTKGKD